MSGTSSIIAILLAAGAGSRFGGDKLLHPLADGVALGAHAARNLLAAGLEVIAVVRPGDAPLERMLAEAGCTVTVCPAAEAGMGHSLAHGVRATPDAAGWIVALGDMPDIQPGTIRMVVTELETGALLAAPSWRGERGHPVGFSSGCRDDLQALTGDNGARAVLQRRRAQLRLLDVDDPGVLRDIDRRDDIAKHAEDQ